MNHISIVIVHYNNREETDACLRSLEGLSLKDATHAVIVVDNGSLQPFEYTGKLSEKQLTVLRSQANLGFTGGNNMGIHHAIETYNSDAVVLLNNDTIVDKNCIQSLHDHAKHFPKAGLICPKIYFAPGKEYHRRSYKLGMKGKVLWYAGGSIDWLHLTAFHRGVDELDREQFSAQLTSEFATGCCVYVKREVLEKVGFLDKRYFLYFEDVDLSIRARQFGYEIHYVDGAKVWHINAGSSEGAGSLIHTYYQTRNRFLFFFTYGSWRTKVQAVRLLFRFLLNGSRFERLAVLHCMTGQWGKQPIV